MLGEALRLLCLSKESSVRALGSPGATVAVRDLCLPEMGLPLVFLLCSVTDWEQPDQHGFHANAAVELRAQQLGPGSVTPPAALD